MNHHQEDSKLPMPESKPLIPFSFSNGGRTNQTMYKQCMKNHAAAIGGHAVDGCGEFMPSDAAEPSDPSSLKCAACGCHRNFHRRVLHSDNSYRSSATPPPRHQLITAPPPRKRARTKFSDEQKLKMKELSEKLGWRMQKGDGAMVESVCREIGVNQGVFKVWMHNNKHIFVGGSSSRRGGGGPAAAGSGGTDDESGGAATGHEEDCGWGDISSSPPSVLS